MDFEDALRTMFPQVDARLIKATVLDGDDVNSAVDFLLKEGLQSYEQKSDENFSPDSHNDHIDDILIMPDSKKHHSTWHQDEECLTDFDKHEESIVWKGGFKSNVPMNAKVICPGQGQYLTDFYGSNCLQEQATLPGNERTDWWATTWPHVAEPEDNSDMYSSLSNSSVRRDSNTRVHLQGVPTVDIDCSFTWSIESSTLEKENASLWSPATGSSKSDTRCKVLAEIGLPLSQEYLKMLSSKTSNPEALDPSIFGLERLNSRSGNKHGVTSDGNSKISSRLSTNVKSVWEDNFFREFFPDSSRYNINTEDLDNFYTAAKLCKENVMKDMEDIALLRQRAEEEELAAQFAKTEAASSGLEIFLKVEDIRQQVSSQKAEYEMRAAEIYGEKSVLAMEAQEVKARLLETQAEQEKALSLLDSIRCSLSERLEKASQEKQSAMEETKMKVKKAEELLASEQASAQKLEQSFKVLEAEAETCKKLREFLIERGNNVDSLQGEMAVLCEDVLTFKEQVDKGIPLSASSRSLSWSRMSHLTEQFLLSSGDVKGCRGASGSTPLERSTCVNSISNTSFVTLCSATSESSRIKQPIECALHSQLFSPDGSMVDMADPGSSKEVINDEAKEGQEAGEENFEALDSSGVLGKEEAENSHSAGTCSYSVMEAEGL